MDMFKDIIPSLLQTKQSVINAENEKEYNPYIINRAISQHPDCLLYVNEMNKNPHLDKLLQYHFYINTLIAKKRPFQKWYKAGDSDDIQAIKTYYGYSYVKANEALRILTPEQIKHIKNVVDTTGVIT